MASPADVRTWGLANGWDNLHERGQLPAALRKAYDAAHPDDQAAPDYPPGMDESMFETADAEIPGDADTGEEPPAAPPARAAAAARARITGLTRGRGRGQGGRGRGKGDRKTTRARIPVDDLIASAWRIAARIAQPLPPLYRTLRIQSPIAGRLLEETVRGTVVDRFLQPLAQVSQMGDAIGALLLPNAAVFLLSTPGVQANPVAAQMTLEMLRHGLMMMMRVGGSKFAEHLARERHEEETYGASVDAMLELILAAPAATQQDEEDRIADLVGKLSGETVGT